MVINKEAEEVMNNKKVTIFNLVIVSATVFLMFSDKYSSVNKAIIAACVSILLIVTSLLVKIKKGTLHEVENKKRKIRYTLWSAVFLVFAVIYNLFLYTKIPYELLFDIDDYCPISVLPQSYTWINLMLVLGAAIVIVRSGFSRKVIK